MVYECGVILAGGKSTRMGKDKALLPFGDAPTLTHYLYERLSPLFSHLYVSAKRDKFGGAFPMIYDRDATTYSPLNALVTILETLPFERIFIVSVDTPLIDRSIIDRLYEHDASDYEALVASLQGKRQPLCAVYQRTALPKMREQLQADRHTLRALLDRLVVCDVHFDDHDIDRFANLNRPEEYDRALMRLLE